MIIKGLNRHGPSPASEWASDFREIRSILAKARVARPDVRPRLLELVRVCFSLVERDLRDRPSSPIIDRWVRAEVAQLRTELEGLEGRATAGAT